MLRGEKLSLQPLEIEKYNFAYINCFVRAVTMEVERLRPNTSIYFSCLHNFIRSYSNIVVEYDYRPSKINGYFVNPDVEEEVNLINFILENYFGLSLKGINTEKNVNIFSLIKENVLMQKAVLLPVNPSILFYCDYYKEKDWIHWLYCNGFDAEKELVFVEDHVQFGMESTCYRPFTFTEDLITMLHSSYNEVWENAPSKSKAYIMDAIGDALIVDTKSFLNEMKKLNSLVTQGNLKLVHIEETALWEKDYDLMFSFKHLKTIYNDIICENLQKVKVSNIEIEKLYLLCENNKKSWDTLARNFKILELRKKKADASELAEKINLIKIQEMEYIKHLSSILNF
ncbi:hypothetical protein [Bacillus cereus]|uniref:hypothetical protein n=1 Tax=Bacillus cereus TaxID=1396 RepID=UPI00384E3835